MGKNDFKLQTSNGKIFNQFFLGSKKNSNLN
jgi:hypothetical protein